MLRLRMDVGDLATTTFAPATPYCELAVSAQELRQRRSPFRRLWRAHGRPLSSAASRLLELVPAAGSVPLFLAPEDRGCLNGALDSITSTPAGQIETELAEVGWASGPSPWVRELAQGRVAALAELGRVVRSYHDEVVEPLWPALRQASAAELQARASQLATEGVAATLNSLHPGIRWHDGVLEVDGPFSADIPLGGRGLRLMPSVWSRPGVAVGWTQPTLVYPLPAASWLQGIDGRYDALVALLGGTRARVLGALTDEHSTSEIARALGISLASASDHAAVLRRAGLITTSRDGRAVRHALTDLGRRVVRGR